MSNQSLREAAQQALECKRLADNYAGACAGCDPGEFATKERDELHVAIDKLTALAQHETGATCDHDTAQPVAEVYRGHYGGRNGSVGFDGVRPLRGAKLPPPGTKLYAAPQPPAEQPFKPDWMNYKQGFADGKAEAEQGAELSDDQIWAMWEFPQHLNDDAQGPLSWKHAAIRLVRKAIAADRAARGGAA